MPEVSVLICEVDMLSLPCIVLLDYREKT